MKGKADRGVYRSIYTSLWDDPAFLELTTEERLILIYLRTSPLSNMPCIYRFYREAVSDHTGLERSLCDRVLDRLCDRGWIEMEKGIVWVKNALKYDPAISLENPKHVEAIRKLIVGLPKLKIIVNFCTYYHLEIPYDIGYREGTTDPMTIQEPEQEKETEPEPKATKTLRPSFASDGAEIRLSSLLLKLIKDRKPDVKSPDVQAWARHVDLMIRVDGRSLEGIEATIRWCQKDPFWQNNILSTAKLREKFDQLGLKMGSEKSPKPSGAAGIQGTARESPRVTYERGKNGQWYRTIGTETTAIPIDQVPEGVLAKATERPGGARPGVDIPRGADLVASLATKLAAPIGLNERRRATG